MEDSMTCHGQDLLTRNLRQRLDVHAILGVIFGKLRNNLKISFIRKERATRRDKQLDLEGGDVASFTLGGVIFP